ncbi:hypothetical protein Sipo8835_00300 [Streptomyces ipomoeae]|jgi:hypothetical protein|uniref:Uncharacterized protein n=2 Tax=Streptomyces ipomoeae TaxID=103232 RepID=L1L3R1_9ACTN|nr:hypothetical protein [Streptomyces ipomoeae]EKX67562.1 hypothetical protein STRIP9103_06832 [Streptomyces ipomoeae 91-03]MDX2700150.1 hypothetical protein [Streptomyces ipomoeae]MDX2827746.1 hypothetical protein [Streptomyces ipomoeae]MDX2845818.1 hypothetical protein [Streptomyces ipomoeae]MDX2880088.1 hypothetical protein [Streptomyces ipomoeae]
MTRWHEGDVVTPKVPTDHPEDPVGEVVMAASDGGVLVVFPLAGHEIYHPDDLAPAERSRLHREHSWRVGDTVTPVIEVDHDYDPVGTITRIGEYGDIVVLFPRAGERHFAPTGLAPADPARLHRYKESDWRIGDAVTPTVETGHPGETVGEVLRITEGGDVVVLFPLAGEETYAPDELAPAAPDAAGPWGKDPLAP